MAVQFIYGSQQTFINRDDACSWYLNLLPPTSSDTINVMAVNWNDDQWSKKTPLERMFLSSIESYWMCNDILYTIIVIIGLFTSFL
jgi:hypothetical protein